MGKCSQCGNETTEVAESVFTTDKRYLCPDCFDKEQNQGCVITIITFTFVLIVIIVLATIFH
mgnify:FL=1